MNESINKSIERGMHLSLSGSTPTTEMSKYVLENALGRKVTMDGYATPAQVLRHLEEVKDEAAAKAAASKAEHQQHHFEFSQALDSVGLGTVFHPEELKLANSEVSLHRGPNDDALTHSYHEGLHKVALARRTGAGTRVGYGSHQNPRDALMMAIKDFNGKRAKGVNEDYAFDKSGKYITEASKSPNAVRMTSSVRQHLGGGTIAQTRNGKYYLLDPRATNGKLPHPGEEINPSKHHYIGDGEWTPKHAEAVERINAALGKIPAIKAVDEAESLNELSKDTLLRYIRKSMRDAGNREVKAGRAYERFANNSSDSDSRKEFRAHELKSAMRQNGIALAARKLARESVNEADSLNELSKDTLASYIRRASIDAATASYVAGRDAQFGGDDHGASARRGIARSIKRTTGIKKAADKLAATPKLAPIEMLHRVNEAESLDELSKETLIRYIHRALPDVIGRSHMAGRDAVHGSNRHAMLSYKEMDKARSRGKGIETAAKKLAEAAPPGMEDWVKANKARFVKEYGDKKGHEVLYATAWKLHDKKANESALEELHPETAKRYMHKALHTMIRGDYDKDDRKFEKRSEGVSRAAKRVRGDFHPGQGNIGEEDDSLKLYLRHEPSKSDPSDPGHRDIAIYGDKDATIFKGRYPWEHRSKPNSRSKQIVLNKTFRPVEWLPASDKIGPRSMAESEQDNIDHVKHMKAYHAAVKATDDASMAKVHFRMRHDISQPDHREAYNQLKRKHREARKAEAAAAEHVKGILFAKHALGEDELNELSPATIRDYLTKAIADHGNMRADRGFLSGRSYSENGTDYDRERAKNSLTRRADKRLKGIQRAIDNMGDDTQRNIKLPAGFGEGVDPGEVSPLFSNK
jgi:hypothetical protein